MSAISKGDLALIERFAPQKLEAALAAARSLKALEEKRQEDEQTREKLEAILAPDAARRWAEENRAALDAEEVRLRAEAESAVEAARRAEERAQREEHQRTRSAEIQRLRAKVAASSAQFASDAEALFDFERDYSSSALFLAQHQPLRLFFVAHLNRIASQIVATSR